ncbi:hypothetical protein GNX71_28655 [Variovorax sp. RKNM96]|uniref:hypothetical protein n=1 Tax=Variovorax sp. RKNM96 TaxID=2681552 RepID=UPI00197D95A7|nr:hypothetical protein [Variovorax sp. RKNM96]QSI33321.1 hypothetical protein GNX71_28655 [Variovorax sp. RKNM96]
MRIHVTLQKPTTVSVDDELMALLGAALVQAYPSLHANAKEHLHRARRFVQAFAKDHRDSSPDGFSRSVQRAIYRRMVAPQILAIFETRDSEETKARAKAADEAFMSSLPRLSPEELAERERQKAFDAKRREVKKTRKALEAVTQPDAKPSHEQMLRAAEALLTKPVGSSLRRA